LFLAVLSLTCSGCAWVDGPPGSRADVQVALNSDYIDQTNRARVALDDYRAVLKMVLSQSGPTLKIYPSEGYYYFSFYSGGDLVRGNLRFDKFLRDDGLVSFAYFRQFAGNKRRTVDRNKHWTLGPADGFFLTQKAPFLYDLRFEDLSASVEIYDAHRELSGSKPLGEGEVYVGPVFDESGVRFHLIFDTQVNVFLFVLNDGLGSSETYRTHSDNDHIQIGNRTRFAYYKDTRNQRRVLMGVNRSNVKQNTYYDGPFDQLPDSFVDPEYLMDLILLYKPSLKGRIGPSGIYLTNENMRTGIYPYMEYGNDDQLLNVRECEALVEKPHIFNRCMARLTSKKK
jgi:hypothetical protein